MQQEINRQNFLRSKYFSSRYTDSCKFGSDTVIKANREFFADDAEFEFFIEDCYIPFDFVMIDDQISIETYGDVTKFTYRKGILAVYKFCINDDLVDDEDVEFVELYPAFNYQNEQQNLPIVKFEKIVEFFKNKFLYINSKDIPKNNVWTNDGNDLGEIAVRNINGDAYFKYFHADRFQYFEVDFEILVVEKRCDNCKSKTSQLPLHLPSSQQYIIDNGFVCKNHSEQFFQIISTKLLPPTLLSDDGMYILKLSYERVLDIKFMDVLYETFLANFHRKKDYRYYMLAINYYEDDRVWENEEENGFILGRNLYYLMENDFRLMIWEWICRYAVLKMISLNVPSKEGRSLRIRKPIMFETNRSIDNVCRSSIHIFDPSPYSYYYIHDLTACVIMMTNIDPFEGAPFYNPVSYETRENRDILARIYGMYDDQSHLFRIPNNGWIPQGQSFTDNLNNFRLYLLGLAYYVNSICGRPELQKDLIRTEPKIDQLSGRIIDEMVVDTFDHPDNNPIYKKI
uniref:Uncharacterized protein n=1 Tax=viral metagenome TaxID=1070528 RepID=A0A6C0IVI3_9ZZZZ